MKDLLSDRRGLGALAGMTAPVLFVGVFTLEGWLRPGYDPMSMYISELSLGPRGWIQIANFVVTGFLLLLFARGVRAALAEGKASRLGPILLTISAVSLFVSGPLVMDPANTPRDEWSWHGILHQLIGALGFFTLAPVICLVFWRRFREDQLWRTLRVWTVVATAIILMAVVLLRIVPVPPADPNDLTQWAGLLQRTAVTTYMAWIFTFALGLQRSGS